MGKEEYLSIGAGRSIGYAVSARGAVSATQYRREAQYGLWL